VRSPASIRFRVVTVIVLALSPVIFAQSATIARDDTDSSDCSIGAAADQIAHRFNALMGIEEPRGCDSPAWHGRDSPRGIVGTMSLRTAMDELVARAPAYRWRAIGDVVVLRPRAAWDDLRNPLDQTTREFNARGVSLRGALHLLLDDPQAPQFFEHTDLPATLREDRSHLSVSFPGGTILQALNSIIRAHGSATWRLGYSRNHAVVALSALDFHGPVDWNRLLHRVGSRRQTKIKFAASRADSHRPRSNRTGARESWYDRLSRVECRLGIGGAEGQN